MISTTDTENQRVNLLWTGGWDSTFRLLKLVLNNREVQPFYIIDPNRESLGHEVRAMQHIRSEISKSYPKASKLLLSTLFIELHDIKENILVTAAYLNIRKSVPVGIQYEWLARFAEERGDHPMEIGIEMGSHGTSKYLSKYWIYKYFDEEGFYMIDEKYKGTDVYNLFKYFKFSIIDLKKRDMKAIAEKERFIHIMGHTWFCHSPISNGKPCGVCKPCIIAIHEGMAYRMPLQSMIRYHLRWLLSLEQFKRTFPGLYHFLKKIKDLLIPKKEK